MKKKITSVVLALSVCSSLGSFASCKFDDGIEQIDTSKTQLYVQNFDGGFGSDWLWSLKEKYEKAHAEDVYEKGKKGVQIMLSNAKILAGDLEKNIMEASEEVFFTQNFDCLFDYIARDFLLDISDIVTEKLPGENRSIEDKMTEQQKDFLCVDYTNSGNGKYYAIPHYSVYTGIIYDIDLFENEGLYLLDDGTYSVPGAFNDGKYMASGRLSTGPDGKYETYDDGLPATYEEFFALCDYMVNKSITPFNWLGKGGDWYLSDVRLSMYADYEGIEQMSLNYNLNGTAKNLISVDENNNITKLPNTNITPQNAYELSMQAGQYYSIDFMSKIKTNTSYHNANKTGSMTYTHLQAQSDFLYSSYKKAPIAMLIDGAWWENEATDTFKAMEQFSLGKMDRRFGLMPFPKATQDKVGERFTVYDGKMAYGVIAKATPSYKHELAKDFLQFCYTDENLAEFSEMTNSFRDLDYTLTDAQISKLSSFGKSMYDIKVSKTMDIVYPLSDNVDFLSNMGTFTYGIDQTYTDGYVVNISTYLGKMSPADMIKAQKEYRISIWDNLNFSK